MVWTPVASSDSLLAFAACPAAVSTCPLRAVKSSLLSKAAVAAVSVAYFAAASALEAY